MADLLARRERLMGAGAPLFYEEPLNIVRGEGVWLFDVDGRRYLDLYNNVPCVGHCHSHVVEAMHVGLSSKLVVQSIASYLNTVKSVELIA